MRLAIWAHENRVIDGTAPIPRGYRAAYYEWDRNATLWLPVGLHWLARAWRNWRGKWAAHILLMRLGFLYDPRGAGFYRDLRWRWDCWNGNRSWWSLRVLRRHGWAVYNARFRGAR